MLIGLCKRSCSMSAELICISATVGILSKTVCGPTVIYSLWYCCMAKASYYRSGFTRNNLVCMATW